MTNGLYCLNCRQRTAFAMDEDFVRHCTVCSIPEGVTALADLRQEEQDLRKNEWLIRRTMKRMAMALFLFVALPALVLAQPTWPVDFDRTCIDAEDGDLSSTIVWTSDIQGEIGTGGLFIADLDEGVHTITLTCGPDSSGDSPDPMVITHTVSIANQAPAFGDASGGGPGLPADGGCSGSDCP